MQGSTNPYAVLGVAPGSDDVVIRAAYRALMFKYHPDRRPASGGRDRAAEIAQAYAILMNPDRRAAYDTGQAQAHTWARPTGRPNASPQAPRRKKRPKTMFDRRARGSWRWRMPVAAAMACALIAFAAWTAADSAAFELPRSVRIELPSAKAMADNPQSALPHASGVGTVGINPARLAVSSPVTAIDWHIIEGAVQQLNVVMQKYGMQGARKVSEKCHDDQSASPRWELADRCAAFDLAASYVDREVSGLSEGAIKRDAYFAFMSDNQIETYTGLGATSDVLNSRVARIRSTAVQIAEEAWAPRFGSRDAVQREALAAANH